jgi:hypothetical protein
MAPTNQSRVKRIASTTTASHINGIDGISILRFSFQRLSLRIITGMTVIYRLWNITIQPPTQVRAKWCIWDWPNQRPKPLAEFLKSELEARLGVKAGPMPHSVNNWL